MSRPAASRRKKAIFACVVVAGVFGTLEAALWIYGLDPSRKGFDPYAGFTSRTPHFQVEVDTDGREMAAVVPSKREVLNDQRFPKRKSAGAYRIVCLGGSTTYGRPFFDATSYPGRLRSLLPELDDSRPWDVINAGAISYASYRLQGLLHELTAFEPDLFVIDAGHNEFLERRTYAGVFRTPRPIREAAGLIGRTRVGTAMERLLHRTGMLGSTTFARSTGLAEDVRRVPVHTVGPEAYEQDDEFRREVSTHFEASLEAMVDEAYAVGARVLLIAPASNLRDFAPFKSRHDLGTSSDPLRRWTEHYHRGLESQQRGDHEAAIADFEEAAAIDARFADLWFRLGRSQLAMARTEVAAASFHKAKEEDVCSFRALEEIQAVVRRVAERRGTLFLDGEKVAERITAHGIPGDDVFCDHVHFQPAGARAMALALVETLRSDGLVAAPTTEESAAIARADARVDSAIDRPRYARELYGLSELLSALGQFEQALGRVHEGLALSGGDSLGFRLAGRCHQELGRLDLAILDYRRAVGIDPRSVEALESLGSLLIDRGDAEEALTPLNAAARLKPGSASIMNRLGIAHAMVGHGAESVGFLQEAVKLAPAEVEIRRNLAMAEARRGNVKEAISHYRAALRLKPGDPASLADLAELNASP